MDSASRQRAATTSPKRKAIVIFLVVSASASCVQSATVQKRSVGHGQVTVGSGLERETCINENPCGWEVYDPTTRNHQYYVTSSCVCPIGEKCVVKSDDLGIYAYVYSCKVIPPRKSKSRTRATPRPISF